VSAGNHAQAVAWASAEVQAPCAVVMPTDAPRSKLDAVRGYGAEVILHADRGTLFERLREVEKERGATFVHPFDDPVVLAGAGTAGLEILEDLPEAEVVVVPVGGGGLMGGVATAVKGMRPAARVIAVELEAGPGLGPALAAGKPVTVTRPAGTLADGMTPPFVGALPLEIARRSVDRIVTVTEHEIIEAMRLLLTRAKLYVEGSGAAATAALLAGKLDAPRGSLVVAIVSGGNVDPEKLLAIFEAQAGGIEPARAGAGAGTHGRGLARCP
jgi:threonine dehydratase